MSTPTPRTDEEAGSLIDAEEVVPADLAALKVRPQTIDAKISIGYGLAIAAEREKVKMLRNALEKLYADTIHHHDYVDDALNATEDKP